MFISDPIGVSMQFEIRKSDICPGRWEVVAQTDRDPETMGIFATHADAVSAQHELTAAYRRTQGAAA